MKKDWCVTKNNTMWTDFLYEEDAKELAETLQEQDRAGFVYEAREMTAGELGENNEE